MMTYAQPASYYYDHSSVLPKGANGKQTQLSEQRYYGSPSSTSSHGSYAMNNSAAHPRTLPPYINVQRASEPASPATIATTISSHSTPSPSPSRNSHLANTAPSSDFTLFDDAIMAATQDMNTNVGKGRTTMDVASTMADNSSGMSHYATSGFPIIVPNDASYSNYASSGMYANYPPNYSTDSTSNLYNINQEQQQQLAQSQEHNSKFLRPATYRGSNTMSSPLSQSHDVESIDNVPALSPTSRNRNAISPLHSKHINSARPSSPRTSTISNEQMARAPSYTATSTAYLQSAMPKLGRTFSDAVQDELYNPELLNSVDHKTDRRNQSISVGKQPSYQQGHIKSESKHSFPQIFSEAQQQHQQDLSPYHGSNQQFSRDRSPFRNDSRYHPSNTPYSVSYNSTENSMPQNQVPTGLDHNSLAMAFALREQMRKEAEQASAPKTISPRDSLLEYHEPENGHNQMNLFPSLQNGRMLPPQDDALSNGSLHTSSQDGSDLDDFHSMATSRRASMANSSVSSHLDVPRYGYMPPQSAFDSVSAAPYYYNDTNNLAAAFPVNDTTNVPYIKEESDYHPIQRPVDTSANSGTYTCTFSGCGHRFTTSTRLQKHRREAHRKAAPSGNSVSTAAAIASRNAQPGPHRCMRINPSTGKPCNTVFSRPYDLTRHEDTIHNSAKEKVRCEICNDEKTFSRPDALVRHRRVKHGIH